MIDIGIITGSGTYGLPGFEGERATRAALISIRAMKTVSTAAAAARPSWRLNQPTTSSTSWTATTCAAPW
jgi:hypothetical protein